MGLADISVSIAKRSTRFKYLSTFRNASFQKAAMRAGYTHAELAVLREAPGLVKVWKIEAGTESATWRLCESGQSHSGYEVDAFVAGWHSDTVANGNGSRIGASSSRNSLGGR